MSSVSGVSAVRRGDRLFRIASALDLLNERIRLESGDVAVALALRARFGPSLPAIRDTQRAIAGQIGRGFHPPASLERLHAALDGLAAALCFPLPIDQAPAPSRPAARRAELRAVRLTASAVQMLGAIAKAMAVGAAATALYASPAAASCVISVPNATCTGNEGFGDITYSAPLVDNLTVKDLSADITPFSGQWAVLLSSNGGDGTKGGGWTAGDPGTGADSLTLTVTDPTYKIIGSDQAAVIITSAGGNGGDGGGAGVGGHGGAGGQGGAGGALTANISIDIATKGTAAQGILAITAGGKGGNGGDFDVGVDGGGGAGGQGGAGGSINIDFGPNSIVTDGKSANGIYAISLGGDGGTAGKCDASVYCGSDGGGDSAVGGTVTVTTAAGSSIHTMGGFSDGINAESIGGYGGGGGGAGFIIVGFGSNGGSAGDGGQVTVTNKGSIQTDSGVSDAIFAQSIGGGGGDGGASGIGIVALGGGGSQGGEGGEVDVTNAGAGEIVTLGKYSRGIFAQSVGGSGGTGGAAGISFVGIGGDGSGTSNGGLVDVENDGTIVTKDAFSQDIFAQSIGGGGGDGGTAASVVSIGGTAGGGGDGGNVIIVNKGTAVTMADQSFAILGMSIGGGGGDGGIAGGALATIGGSGGDGGKGGDVSITTDGEVHTSGYHSMGVFAQSVGGGGGLGGDAAGGFAFIHISIGGSGGDGGDGGTVTVTAGPNSDIQTGDARADAITAQSIGGGGGNGGYGAGAAGGAFGAINIGIGGTGGDGGKGGDVTVSAAGSITTFGMNSRGIFAQSIGGGGGDGGYAVSASGAGGPVAFNGSVAVGGSGGLGGDAGTVTVANTADILTAADRSSGIYAQSVGGGGGSGGWSSAIGGAGGSVGGAISVSVGGSGKGGGDGQAVTVGNTGDINTVGADSFGVFAQSVGGGGGFGGFSVGVAGAGGGVAGTVAVSVGGQGAGGGAGSTVDVSTSGDILTQGDRSIGVVAQSLGGGGGDGGFSGAAGVSGGATSVGVAVSVGGFGGGGGTGGLVTLASSSDVETQGEDAFGMIAQSVGGGGGNGGFSVGAGVGAGGTSVGATVDVGGLGGKGGAASTVELTSSGDVLTLGDRSIGILAQSVGGGGGNGGFTGSAAVGAGGTGIAVSVGIGGFGGSGGNGGDVTLASSGTVDTVGEDAFGVMAQSIGGGGGNGGFAVGASVGAGGNGVAPAISIGGSGGAAGDAGTVTLSSTGAYVVTHGDRSVAIGAQSVGGGGGDGGFTADVGVGAGATGVGVEIGVGGAGGAAGDGKTVILASTSDVQTDGFEAFGIFAQSVGGGGGRGGFSVGAAVGAGTNGVGLALNVGGSGGAGGSAGDVTVSSSGDVVTEGDRSVGITAQSIGGGGGDGGFAGSVGVGAGTTGVGIAIGIGGFGKAGGDAGKVVLTSTGQVQTAGDDAQGLFAQSVGGGGGDGGFAAGAAIGAGKTAAGASLVLGGFGGAAGNAGEVVLTSTDQVYTTGDRSTAIQAQSLGGGGGNGGVAADFSGAFGGASPVAIGLGLGGFGGAGGNAGDVTVTSTGGAWTNGEDAHGVFAQSIGGGGGEGGFTVGGTLSAGGTQSVALKASIGGFGGAAGNAGDVTVTTAGYTHTIGAQSYGVFAQSIGGGGGDGGWAGSLDGSFGSTKSFAISATVGGNGGASGSAGEVTVTSNGVIETDGDGSHGILAQSVGGGGGNGGMAVSANIGATKATNIGVSLGGQGGASGVGGTVIVTATDVIETTGQGSDGILAQSVGGGGGNGGAAGALSLSSSNSINLNTSIGGFAANGSVGGTVTVNNSGIILTTGELSDGIEAQSTGGGGGHGGMAGIDENGWADYLAGGAASLSFGQRSQDITVSLGGSGGKGEDAGTVTVNNSGDIETENDSSTVIFAQSTGGGGGDGGVSTAASGAFGTAKNGTYSVAVGGTGGVAGNGGLVDVENSGQLLSLGDGSPGVFAQSVGGGGGNGGQARGFAMSFSTNKKTKGAASVSVSVGGQGGASGNGGEVKVDNSGQIVTDGAQSYGIHAESIGGGGGDGGEVSTQGQEINDILDLINKGDAKGGNIAIGGSGGAAGDGGTVIVNNTGVIWTQGTYAHGVFAESIGGGGGNGGDGLAGTVSVGGQGGAAGDGGTVTVTNTKFIETDGEMAQGVFAQSIGGGGGDGGATDYTGNTNFQYLQGLADTMNVVDNLITTAQLAKSFKEPDWGVGIGGFGGAAGNGGTVTVTNSGNILTKGDFANGILAQSVGGGGGTGGVGQLTNLGQVVFSGLGGNSGNGGDVKVVNTGTIETNGFGSFGIFAQSVGGGGGIAGNYALALAGWGNLTQFGGTDYSQYLNVQLNPIHANGGNGGAVTVINTGDIILNGIGSIGIFAQSVGGGGGLFGGSLSLGFAGSMNGVGHGGQVTIVQNGDIIVSGKNAIGAFFQSASDESDDDIVATINGAVTGGSVYGKAVLIDGGKDNTVTLNGIAEADSNVAIVATIGNDTINANAGVIGNVDLGTGNNVFNNNHGSTFVTLDYVQLNGGPLNNAGVVSPGGAGAVQVTAVTGDYNQASTGQFFTDLDLARTGQTGENDRLDISGNINAQGAVILNILDPGYALPGDHTTALLAGGGSATSSGLQLIAPVSVVASFGLQTTAHDVNLTYDIDFAPAGLNANQAAIGHGIDAIQLAGSSPAFAPVAAELFGVASVSQLAAIYDSISPETYAVQAAVLNFASQRFADSMMTCPEGSAAVFMPERGCIWAKPNETWLNLDATSANLRFHEMTQGVSGGWEMELGPQGWRVGGAMSADKVDSGLTGHTNSDGWRYQGGFVVMKSIDALTLEAAVHGGSSTMNTSRVVLTPGGVLNALGNQKLSYLAGAFRASYRFGTERAYLKPMVEASQLKVDTDGFSEIGAGALDLVIPKQSDDYTRVSAKLETGGEFAAGGVAVRPYSRIGVSRLAGGDNDLFAAAFAGAPAGVQGFSVSPGLDRTTLDAEAGVAVVGRFGSARFSWSGQFGDRTHSQVLALRFTKAF